MNLLWPIQPLASNLSAYFQVWTSFDLLAGGSIETLKGASAAYYKKERRLAV